MSYSRYLKVTIICRYCHENFGPLKILVRGTKICGEMVPPGPNFSKILVHVWRFGPPPFWFKVHYSSTVKHHAMLLRSKVATQVLSNFVHLLNCCQRMAIKVCWPCMHGSVISEAAEKHTLEVWKITNLMIMLKRRSSWLRRHIMST